MTEKCDCEACQAVRLEMLNGHATIEDHAYAEIMQSASDANHKFARLYESEEVPPGIAAGITLECAARRALELGWDYEKFMSTARDAFEAEWRRAKIRKEMAQ